MLLCTCCGLKFGHVRLLRLLWVSAVVWFELTTFFYHVSYCKWPDSPYTVELAQDARPTHVLMVADPQILDHRSYPGRPPWLSFLSQVMVDLNLRKSWSAAKRLRPDAVVFLGDMMDGGRIAMPDEEYETYYQRFRSIFSLESDIPVHYIPGNHDVGLGTSSAFSDRARQRYASHFGPLNQVLEMGNHTFVLIDAPGLVEEDLLRKIQGVSYAQWAATTPGGPIALMHSFAQGIYEHPTVLLSHIPLARPDGTSCGPLREKGTIRGGVGLGYQNTLSDETSQFLLDSIRPSAVFSGDDHDYCEVMHTIPSSNQLVKEISAKSFSMAMGIHRPGFQLLFLRPPSTSPVGSAQRSQSITEDSVPCFLPDQLSIYLDIYVPLIIWSVLVLVFANVLRIYNSDCRTSRRTASSTPVDVEGAQPKTDFDDADDGEDASPLYALPTPGVAVRATQRRPQPRYSRSWSFVFKGRRRRMTLEGPLVACICWGRSDAEAELRRSRAGLLRGFMTDLVDVAWPPLALFVGIAWWMFR